ncbi:hypothetical protein H072_4108 [Dactylellina haptotyla CBS 200.50]|uniref:Chromatin modification-related protein n=1 Tax=Dactylellina haptotyla (strain CBS 200.50) TaxID=1284197 RepID=S8AFW3_DACHA|nr:hypothetical protein H072_4108 [Dactylellina haptotyla CBS 200.50]
MNSHLRKPTQFYPGLAAFTDAIEALPQETIRHFTLLREVDAKASGPEDLLRSSIKQSLGLLPLASTSDLSADLAQNHISIDEDGHAADAPQDDTSEQDRRARLHHVRLLISDLLLTLDEKIHVISTASEALAKHLVRIDDAYETVAQEIDPVVRDGNPAHWAYGVSVPDGSVTTRLGGTEHPHGPIAHAGGYLNEMEAVHSSSTRVETRREGGSRRHATIPDALDPKISNSHSITTLTESSISAHENSPVLPVAKRRKGAAHSTPANKTLIPERSSGVHRAGGTSNPVNLLNTTKGHGPHATSTPISSSKASGSRKRTSGHPPSTTSSPISQTSSDIRVSGVTILSSESLSAATNENGKKDPVHRNPRTKKELSKTELPKPTQKIDADVKQEDKFSPFESRLTPTPRLSQDKTVVEVNEVAEEADISHEEEQFSKPHATTEPPKKMPAKDEKSQMSTHGFINTTEKISKANDALDKTFNRGSSSTNSLNKGASKSLLLPETLKGSQPISRKVMTTKTFKSTKTLVTRDQDERVGGASEDIRENEEGEEEEAEGDPDEMRYCYCNQVSYGKMVACDGPGCQREWFHLPCVGLTHMPSTKDKWYCNECRNALQNIPKAGKSSQHRS